MYPNLQRTQLMIIYIIRILPIFLWTLNYIGTLRFRSLSLLFKHFN